MGAIAARRLRSSGGSLFTMERLSACSLAMVVVKAFAEMGNDCDDHIRRDAGGDHRSHQPELVL
jgi:hypothetical protein